MQENKRVDRKNGPVVNRITELHIPNIYREILANGTEYIEVNLGTQNLVQLEVLYRGGRISEQKQGVSRATSRLLKEGTKSFSSSQLAERVDFYGANMTSGASLDYAYAKAFSLTKHFDKILPSLSEMLNQPTFPQHELDKYIVNSVQKLKVEKAKSELVAYRTITECLYGPEHPYGYNSTKQMYQDLNRNDLVDFYHSNFGSDNRIIILSGKITPEIRESVKQEFGNELKEVQAFSYQEPTTREQRISKRLKGEDDLQCAVKIGCRLFKREHPNFADMFILNTILGGYFGSRLMSTLREDKGYTYNIYSSIDMMIYDGYFNISTEVGNEYLEPTLEGIYHEMEQLKSKKVGEEELDMVRNYLSGNFLNMIDGPFKLAGMSKVIALNNLNFDFYKNLMRRIHTITSDDIYQLAQKYLNKEKMVEIIVGNP
ncbi:MAG: pitrilysin family protein [Saprospiraceae bacterium]|nr:pitrilysin family protein [Saprospiraceae bacterium]